ncbi:hypothetical protein BK403_27985 [Escherichia coli]|uniref:CAP domain-containing protein n=4 Tax=Enterobacteriaceae TaxID=543 RepID=UPI0009277905|nr:CAP domain-containing protein [Escherichia coli]OJS19292.1 hypothetical protein BK397_24015 [Escherichia coli]OJS43212.1 hypothetical protein BK403_27985 [Escherichia coli]
MGWDRFPRAIRGTLAVLCALAGAVSASADPGHPAYLGEIPHTQPPASEAERLLVMHNAERTRLGLPPLTWNVALARDAADYARILLVRGGLEHASERDRRGTGENLWMGTAGAWKADAMISMFLEERRYFRTAVFPDISLTGNWKDAGHYSQIVWRETREVGCAIETGNGMDVLVCRYFPAGNVIGQSPY